MPHERRRKNERSPRECLTRDARVGRVTFSPRQRYTKGPVTASYLPLIFLYFSEGTILNPRLLCAGALLFTRVAALPP